MTLQLLRFSPDPQLDMHTYDVNTIEEQRWKLETTKQRKAVCLQSMKSKDSRLLHKLTHLNKTSEFSC